MGVWQTDGVFLFWWSQQWEGLLPLGLPSQDVNEILPKFHLSSLCSGLSVYGPFTSLYNTLNYIVECNTLIIADSYIRSIR